MVIQLCFRLLNGSLSTACRQEVKITTTLYVLIEQKLLPIGGASLEPEQNAGRLKENHG
jgi:hypothetical protein